MVEEQKLLSDELLTNVEAAARDGFSIAPGTGVALCQSLRAAWKDASDLRRSVEEWVTHYNELEAYRAALSVSNAALREQLAQAQKRSRCTIKLIRERAAKYGDEAGISLVLETLASELENLK